MKDIGLMKELNKELKPVMNKLYRKYKHHRKYDKVQFLKVFEEAFDDICEERIKELK